MEGRKILKRIFAALGILIILGYSYFVLDDYIRGPRIIIESPLNGYSTTTPAIIIIGRGIHTNNISVNGAQVPVDLEGNFRSQLILAPGYNIIKVTAKDNYERTVEKTIEMNLVEYGMLNVEDGMDPDTGASLEATTTPMDTSIISNF